MDKKEEIKKELEQLIEEGSALFELAKKVKGAGIILDFGTKYQNWYTKALRIVTFLANDRIEEFISYYRIDAKRKVFSSASYVIQDFIMGREAVTTELGKPLWDTNNVTAIEMYNQLQILQSLENRIDYVLSDVQGVLLSELQDKELVTAEDLLKVSVRAAGSLAGVILENHLQKVAQNHGILISKKNPTISDLNDPLKNEGVCDIPTWRKIQYLGDIRNLCDHKKDREPTEEEVKELIAGVNQIIKKVF